MFVASGLAGMAGALMAPLFGVGPFIGAEMVVNSFIIIIIGGVGSILGAVLGSIVLGFVTSLGGTFLSGDEAQLISFVLLIVILVFRPRGLVGGT
jgi:branched-chain amino acid transport system permease protein